MDVFEIVKQVESERNSLSELLPSYFREDFIKESFVSGGCIYSYHHDQEPKDIDVFIRSEDLVDELSDYFNRQRVFKKRSNVRVGKYRDHNLVLTDNAISIRKYQIITRWTGEPEKIVSQFDFKHNMFWVQDGRFYSLVDFSYLEGDKVRYNEQRARDICGTIMRIPKFIKKGMKVPKEEIAKMLLKLNEVGFNDRELEILIDSNADKSFGS
ncbi:hypothetical protein RVS70_05260 [Virgibacillus sp. M23]|uniref:hypothetical protein n=1 Tax=Virgibacillus sp. M23 TaxID=3079030 RepID=UPI002A91F9FC|nr:hypothetical protein [Virgibacillus sp. M23]MDY7043609.1 hypothetical protein [Virgibacillus sp. M23]